MMMIIMIIIIIIIIIIINSVKEEHILSYRGSGDYLIEWVT
jgi:competence protein ComGC